MTADNDLDLWAFGCRQTPPDMGNRRAFPPLITILTTAGTGAETESAAMITDTARLMKWCLWHVELKPAFVVLDPELTVGLPANLMAWTGVDAMVHAIEAYCVLRFNPLCDGMGVEGRRLVAHWLPVAVAEPSKVETWGAMLAGSFFPGAPFSTAWVWCMLFLIRLAQNMITQHGLINEIVLPAKLRHNAPAITDKVAVMAQAMGLSDTSFDASYTHICTLIDQLDIPKTLVEIGVAPECAASIAGKALEDSAAGTNPAGSGPA